MFVIYEDWRKWTLRAVTKFEFTEQRTHQKAGSVVEKTPETDGEAALQKMTVLGWESVVQGETRILGWQKRIPHELPLEFLSIFAVNQLVHALVDDVGLKQTKKGDNEWTSYIWRAFLLKGNFQSWSHIYTYEEVINMYRMRNIHLEKCRNKISQHAETSEKWKHRSRVAQWKRAGPITQRSVDRNHALLKGMISDRLFFIFFSFYCKLLLANWCKVSKYKFSFESTHFN